MTLVRNMRKSTKELYKFILKEMPVINKTKENEFSLDIDGVRELRITTKELNLIGKKLDSSCYNAVKRGKPNYIRPGYENVSCQWDKGLQMKEGLMKLDKDVIRHFVVYGLKWIINGMNNNDQPCFSRPNDEGDYVVGNIAVDTRINNELQKNRDSVSRPCILIASVNGNIIPEEITEYKSTTIAAKSVVERLKLKCTSKTISGKAGEGKSYRVLDEYGNTWNILIQTDYSKNPSQSDALSVQVGSKIYYPY